MFVHAHPDDESSKGAATMARYVREGHRVSIVTCTDGMAGDILNPAMDRPGIKERMAQIRTQEMAAALEVLGITEHRWLGYPDSGYVEEFDGDGSRLSDDSFYNTDLAESTGRLVGIVRELRPDVVVTYPPGGGYPHPDHIRCHDVAVAAYRAAGDASAFPDAGEPWTPRKLYYLGAFNPRRVRALHSACEERGIDSPFTRFLDRGYDLDADDPTTTSVDVGDYLEYRDRALIAHATQVDPNSMWFRVPNDLIRAVYPYEDFELADSAVDVETPESSLFAGLEATAPLVG
jgi:mycothiol S-conjugate amidase